ncbi:MAG TPA: SDR family oxidoreductase, partial [Candidatus Tumulicola sp.]|nr:SDR family oxidoreductase [Candidatus Tumulicola sp.]
MHYVVTGGAGFIGSHLVEHLVTAAGGHRVTVLDNFSTGKRENLAPWLDRVRVVEGSVTDPNACREAIAGADFVLHQAALPSVPRSLRDPVASHEANATGTLNVLIAARDEHVKRVVYAASSSAYGNTAELPKREEMLPRPLSPYAAAKYAGEQYCRAFHASFGVGTIALRYFNVFGPRQDPTSQYAAVIPKFIVCAQAGESPTIFGDGEQTRDFTFVRNVVRANLLACEAPPAALGEAYNVGCGERVSVNALWRRIRDLLGATVEARYEPSRTGDVRDSLASLDRVHAMLGYAPVVALDDGLRETIRSLTGREPAAVGSPAAVR